jgi:hypothetical protein
VAWEDSEETSQPQKCHSHLCRPTAIFRRANLVDRTGWKSQSELRVETHHFLGRARLFADRLKPWVQALQHAHGLKEVEPVPFFKKDVF